MFISAFLLLSGLVFSKVTDTHDVEYEVWHQIDTAAVPVADTKFIQRGGATISKLTGVFDGLYETKAGAYDQLNSKVGQLALISGRTVPFDVKAKANALSSLLRICSKVSRY